MIAEQQLDRLAEIAVKIGVNVQPGQELIINAPVDARLLVQLVAAHAYRVGASLVVPFYNDDCVVRARFENAEDSSFDFAPTWLYDGIRRSLSEGAAMLSVVGADPTVLAGFDPKRVGRMQRAQAAAARPMRNLISSFAVNWSVVAFATPAWARSVFPDDIEPVAVEKLWRAILSATRADRDDPVSAWREHADQLLDRCETLNAKHFEVLHFRGPGTDLRVGLVDDHVWVGGATEALNGIVCLPNLPTEEVFTMPHRERVEGVVRASKPLVHGGVLIEDIAVRFEKGRIVEACASRGEEIFRSLIATDEGAARLGEVALVPDGSPVARSGLTFRNTLFDENAASHIALGQAYAFTRRGGGGMEAGANESLIHVDWMIGSDRVDVDGITPGGSVVPVMRAGAFVI